MVKTSTLQIFIYFLSKHHAQYKRTYISDNLNLKAKITHTIYVEKLLVSLMSLTVYCVTPAPVDTSGSCGG